tara:strand:- start:1257 stop:1388 length:132 start_codon:yes stop_codon:yes gene_type:complete
MDWEQLERVLKAWKSGEETAAGVAIAIDNLIEAKIIEREESNE